MPFRSIMGLLLLLMSSCSNMKNNKETVARPFNFETQQGYKVRRDFLKAHSLSLDDDHAQAFAIYKELFEHNPTNPFLKKKFAIELIRNQELNKALPLLEDIYKEKPDELVGILLGNTYLQLKKPLQAFSVFKKNNQHFPQSLETCTQFARAKFLFSGAQSALTTLQHCQKNLPDEAEIDYVMGEIYQILKKDSLAILKFKQALLKNPLHTAATSKLGLYYEKSSPVKAMEVYKESLAFKPEQTMFLEKLVHLNITANNVTESIAWLEKLCAINPDSLENQVKLGLLYSQVKNYKRSIEIFEELNLKVPKSERINFYLGLVYAQAEKYVEALNCLKLINQDKDLLQQKILHQAQILRILSLDKNLKDQNYREEFVHFIDQSQNYGPELTVPLVLLKVSFYEEEKNYQSAIEALRPYESESFFTLQHRYYLATLFNKADRFSEAQDQIWKILKIDPKYAHAWNFLGYAMLEKNLDLKEAYQYLHKAYVLAPRDGMILDSLGLYHYKIGNYSLALQFLTRAFQRTGLDSTVLRHLADTYMALKEFQLAKKFYGEVLKQTQEGKERGQIENLLTQLEEDQTRLPSSLDSNP